MEEKVNPQPTYIIKAQRFLPADKKSFKLMIYSLCCKIPITLLPYSGIFKDALGDRPKAAFLCTKEGENFNILQEVYLSDL